MQIQGRVPELLQLSRPARAASADFTAAEDIWEEVRPDSDESNDEKTDEEPDEEYGEQRDVKKVEAILIVRPTMDSILHQLQGQCTVQSGGRHACSSDCVYCLQHWKPRAIRLSLSIEKQLLLKRIPGQGDGPRIG